RSFDHYARWWEEKRRLYRVFEFLETRPRAAGLPPTPGDRIPGKININTVWDPEVLLALCDPQPSNNFTPDDLRTIFGRMLEMRTPELLYEGGPGPDDRPFLALATGWTPGRPETQYPHGIGREHTLLRSFEAGQERLLFQPPVPLQTDPNRH